MIPIPNRYPDAVIECVFWLYYCQGLIYNSLKSYNKAVNSFNTAINYKNYGLLLAYNTQLFDEEIQMHQQLFASADKDANSKIASSNEVAARSNTRNLLFKYQQLIECFSDQKNYPLSDWFNFMGTFDMQLDNSTPKLQNSTKLGYTHYYKALNLIALQKYREAITSLNKTIKLLPDFYPVYIEKAKIYITQKKYQKVVQEYNKAIEIRPDEPQLYFDRSVALFELGNTTKAKEDFAKWEKLSNNVNKKD